MPRTLPLDKGTARAKTHATAAGVKRYHTRPAKELSELTADPHELKHLAAEPQHAACL